MPRITRITVSFSRQVSDGNYGSETVRHEVEVVAQDDDDELDNLISERALENCRMLVHAELARSPNWSIRRAVEPPQPTAEHDDQDQEGLPF
jgi:hypothetical protein